MQSRLLTYYGFFFALLLTGWMLSPSGGHAAEFAGLVETYPEGCINWSLGFIQGKAVMPPPQRQAGGRADRAILLTAAKAAAQENLLEVLKTVRVTSRTVVGALEAKDAAITRKLENLIRSAETVKQEYLSDGTVAVTLQLSLRGGVAQLLLPPEIQQLDTIKLVKPADETAGSPDEPASRKAMNHDEAAFSGLVVDARAIGASPALVPRILDENGEEVYGPAFVSREFAVQAGLSGYCRQLERAQADPRVADNPLTVKGLSPEGPGNSNIVISHADAARIRGVSEHLLFLRRCRVTIVLAP